MPRLTPLNAAAAGVVAGVSAPTVASVIAGVSEGSPWASGSAAAGTVAAIGSVTSTAAGLYWLYRGGPVPLARNLGIAGVTAQLGSVAYLAARGDRQYLARGTVNRPLGKIPV